MQEKVIEIKGDPLIRIAGPCYNRISDIFAWSEEKKKEVLFIGLVKKLQDCSFLLYDILIPLQEASAASCDTEKYEKEFNAMLAGLNPEQLADARAWCHTHPHMLNFHSGTDEATHHTFRENFKDWSISLNVARNRSLLARIELPDFKISIDNVPVEIVHEVTKDEGIIKELEEKVKDITYQYNHCGCATYDHSIGKNASPLFTKSWIKNYWFIQDMDIEAKRIECTLINNNIIHTKERWFSPLYGLIWDDEREEWRPIKAASAEQKMHLRGIKGQYKAWKQKELEHIKSVQKTIQGQELRNSEDEDWEEVEAIRKATGMRVSLQELDEMDNTSKWSNMQRAKLREADEANLTENEKIEKIIENTMNYEDVSLNRDEQKILDEHESQMSMFYSGVIKPSMNGKAC